MAHDFIRFPELTNSQLDFYYWDSPHKQILEDFEATVVKVHDGDTITVRWEERDFDFPVRFLDTNAPEMNEEGGEEARDFLSGIILNAEIEILINKRQRVGKWGRILGTVMHFGTNINDFMIDQGFSTSFENREEGKIPDINKELKITI